MKDLLKLLGKRVNEFRTAKGWSQEEFAHVSGFHRTYVGQIERGEKNISFANLLKLSCVFGVTMAELLAGLESGGSLDGQSARRTARGSKKVDDTAHLLFEIQKVAKRLKLQQGAMDATVAQLERLATTERLVLAPPRNTRASQKLQKS